MQLALPAFVAGVLTFLAPCTLPLVPGFVSYLGGSGGGRRGKLINSLWYVTGFTLVFVSLGIVFGLGGAGLGAYKVILGRIGGILLIVFGAVMLGLPVPGLGRDWKIGYRGNAFMLGVVFALGWSPCVGPILGTVLLLAANSATVASGAWLLFVYSLGLAVPFMAMALLVGQGAKVAGKWLVWIEKIGGVLLIAMGVLIVSGNLEVWVAGFYKLFGFIKYQELLNYL